MIGFHRCDVGLIVPLQEEFEQLQKIATVEGQYRIGNQVYSRIRNESIEIWATCIGEMGNAPALQCTKDFIDFLRPQLVICTEIGGSLKPQDLGLGDIAVSRYVKDISDAAKVRG